MSTWTKIILFVFTDLLFWIMTPYPWRVSGWWAVVPGSGIWSWVSWQLG